MNPMDGNNIMCCHQLTTNVGKWRDHWSMFSMQELIESPSPAPLGARDQETPSSCHSHWSSLLSTVNCYIVTIDPLTPLSRLENKYLKQTKFYCLVCQQRHQQSGWHKEMSVRCYNSIWQSWIRKQQWRVNIGSLTFINSQRKADRYFVSHYHSSQVAHKTAADWL